MKDNESVKYLTHVKNEKNIVNFSQLILIFIFDLKIHLNFLKKKCNLNFFND